MQLRHARKLGKGVGTLALAISTPVSREDHWLSTDTLLQLTSCTALRCTAEFPWRILRYSAGPIQTSSPDQALAPAATLAELLSSSDCERLAAALDDSTSDTFTLDVRTGPGGALLLGGSGIEAQDPDEERHVRLSGRVGEAGRGQPRTLELIAQEIRPVKQRTSLLASAHADGSPKAAAESDPAVGPSSSSAKMAESAAGRFQELIDQIPQIVWSANDKGDLEYVNETWLALYGTRDATDPIADFLSAVHPSDRRVSIRLWREAVATGLPFEAQVRLRHHSGKYLWMLARAQPKQEADGSRRWFGTCTDIHSQIVAQEMLSASRDINQSIVDASPDPISLLDLDGNILAVNQALRTGWQEHSIEPHIGSKWGSRCTPEVAERYYEAVAVARTGRMARFITKLEGGSPKWWDIAVVPIRSAEGATTSLVAISRDITEQTEAAKRVEWAANHDALTSLANRSMFQKQVDAAIEETRSGRGAGFTLLVMDVDQFKCVNDVMGHDAGDALLCAFAERLRANLSEHDTVARLGGDEFAVLLAGVTSLSDIQTISSRILNALREPWSYQDRLVECGASIGASIFPEHGQDRTELIKHADIALYSVKTAGRGNWQVFEPHMRAEIHQRTAMLNLAKEAVRCDRLRPFYQPQVAIADGRILGFEALLRLSDNRNRLQLPSAIGAAFEDHAVATAISDRMVSAVLTDLRAWLEEGFDVGHVAINASTAEFRTNSFAERLLERLDRAQVPPHLLQVEVTESVLIGRGAEYVERALEVLRQSGVRIALDDFGTGYASLTHLRQFPVDVLKIDQTFTKEVESAGAAASITTAVINLGHSLGLNVVAEGVETEGQHDFLRAAGCLEGQGHFYGRAVPASVAREMMMRCPTSSDAPGAMDGLMPLRQTADPSSTPPPV